MLRDPITRWISYLRYLRLLEPEGAVARRSLREYAEWLLEQPAHTTLQQLNAQTNFIAEHEWYRMNRADVNEINWDMEPELFERYLRERLTFAKATLDRFGVVGTVERLGDFTRVLQARAIGWDVPLVRSDGLNFVNATQAPPVDAVWITPADSVGRRLLEAFAADFELHRSAGERLLADLASVR